MKFDLEIDYQCERADDIVLDGATLTVLQNQLVTLTDAGTVNGVLSVAGSQAVGKMHSWFQQTYSAGYPVANT